VGGTLALATSCPHHGRSLVLRRPISPLCHFVICDGGRCRTGAAMPRSYPPIPGALRALAPLDPDQRRWLLSTDGTVEAGLTPAGLSAAATWAHTEAVSKELLQAVLPGAAAVTPPTAVPGAALTVDLGHLVRRSG